MWQWFVKDNVVSERPCRLRQLVVCGADGSDGRLVLYDGLNANGRHLVTMRVKQDTTKPLNFPAGLPCSEGLYLDIIGGIDGVLVIWDYPGE